MRTFALTCLTIAAAAAPPAAAAQEQPPAAGADRSTAAGMLSPDAPVMTPGLLLRTWAAEPAAATCAFPAPEREMRDRIVFLTAYPLERDSALRAPPELLSLLAQELGRPLLRLERGATGEAVLGSADGELPPIALRTSARLVLHGNGALSGLEFRPGADGRLAGAIAAAFDTLARQGGIGPFSPFGDSLRIPLVLAFLTDPAPDIGRAPVFRLTLPNDRPVEPVPGNRPPAYPESARAQGAEGVVIVQFVVDEEGRPVRESLKSIQPPKPLPPHLRQIFRSFENAAMRRIPSYRFHAAESLGCRVKMYVQMPFAFQIRR